VDLSRRDDEMAMDHERADHIIARPRRDHAAQREAMFASSLGWVLDARRCNSSGTSRLNRSTSDSWIAVIFQVLPP